MMSWARIVPAVSLAWNVDARQPAARVRLNAIAARISQAPFAENDPEGRCASGPDRKSAWTCSMTACPRWCFSACTRVSGLSVNTQW